MPDLSRRQFVRSASLLAAVPWALRADVATGEVPSSFQTPSGSDLKWLGGRIPRIQNGTTWGRSWPKGKHSAETEFALSAADGSPVPLQSWPLAYWPDGSLKWTAHALPADAKRSESYDLQPGKAARPATPLTARQNGAGIEIDTGVVQVRIGANAGPINLEVSRGSLLIAHQFALVCRIAGFDGNTSLEELVGQGTSIALEQSGAIRAVVKIEGTHRSALRALIPFIVRLYFYAGGDCIRLVHTMLFDGDAARDRIAALGLSLRVPMRGELHDRHVRFSGREGGLFAESVRGLTGLRRDPGEAVKQAQLSGKATPPVSTWNKAVAERLQYIPAFGDWTLHQATCDGFEVRKRTKPTCGWVSATKGTRAGGLAYVGTPNGGVSVGLRHFWESFPAQLDVRDATSDEASITAWLWAPDSNAMDLRPYHDGMGQDTYEEQYNGGLEITYEDYEPGFNSPEGVGRTSELNLWIHAATPDADAFLGMQESLEEPPLLVSSPEYIASCEVFGKLWNAPAPQARYLPLEERLSSTFDFYLGQREERRWYGFWDFGDVMHTYDADRHTWRYDVGGFAWDNSELSTDIWLWLYYLRTGRPDVFRFAEAMTRHTGEVDVHHIGRFAPLGSRHNVQHWGCSGKQLRISTALNRRYYYYLTADERVGDLMREQVDAGWSLLRIPPGRKLGVAAQKGDLDRGHPTNPESVGLSVGTDWGSLAGAWLTEWERTRDPVMKERLLAGMRTIGAQPLGFFSTGLTMNLRTGAFDVVTHKQFGVSHLNAVFGLPEVCAELIQLLDVPEFKKAWLDYCTYYNASPEEQTAFLGRPLKGASLWEGHSRLTAYAAAMTGNPALAARAWKELEDGRRAVGKLETTVIDGPTVMRSVHEAKGVSTNDSAQWGLAAIQCMALLGNAGLVE